MLTYTDCGCGPQIYDVEMDGGVVCAGSAALSFGHLGTVTGPAYGGIVCGGSATVSSNLAWDGYDRIYHLLEQGNGTSGEYLDMTGHIGGTAGIEPRTLQVQGPTRIAGVYVHSQEFYGSEWISFPSTRYPAGQDLTVSLWAKTSADFLPRVFFTMGKTVRESTPPYQVWYVALGHTGSRQPFATVRTIDASGDWQTRTATSPLSLSKNCWKHLSLVFDAGSQLRLYVNGVLAASTDLSEEILAPSTAGNFLGRRDQYEYTQGAMSELRIIPEVKSADWLRSEYVNGCDTRAYDYGLPLNPVYS